MSLKWIIMKKTLLTLDKNVWNRSQNDVRRTNTIGIYGNILLKIGQDLLQWLWSYYA